jgi:hypothetical protein
VKNNTQVIREQSFAASSGEIIVFNQSFGESCSVIVKASSGDEKISLGALVAPQALKPELRARPTLMLTGTPKKNNWPALPLNVNMTKVELPEGNTSYTCFDTELNCPGPKPARGYFAKPPRPRLIRCPLFCWSMLPE